MKEVAASYPAAIKSRVVQDTLNTPNESAFYEPFSAEEALASSQRFEVYYTPKGASWRNMQEIEFSALAKQCLDRRIPSQEQLAGEYGKEARRPGKRATRLSQSGIFGGRRFTLSCTRRQ
jgi:hypothetical protein